MYDNSGVNQLTELYKEAGWTSASRRLPVLSDAGRDFVVTDWNERADSLREYNSFLALATRVTNAQGDRIAVADSTDAAAFFQERGIDAARLSIACHVSDFDGMPESHSTTVQRLLAATRTELDRFSPEEVLALYRHGYLVAQQEIGKHSNTLPQTVPWTPVDDVAISRNGSKVAEASRLLVDIDSVNLAKRLRSSNVNKKQRQLRLLCRAVGALGVLLILALILAAWLYGAKSGQSSASGAPAGALSQGNLTLQKVKADIISDYDETLSYFYLPALLLERDETDSSLLTNADFLKWDGKPENDVVHWRSQKGNCGAVFVVPGKGRSLGRSVGIRGDDCVARRQIYLDQDFSNEEMERIRIKGQTVTMRVWVKTARDTDPPGPEMLAHFATKATISLAPKVDRTQEDFGGWKLREITVTVPSEANGLTVRLNAYAPAGEMHSSRPQPQSRNITPDGDFRPSKGTATKSGTWNSELPAEESIQFTFQGSTRTITRIVFTVGGGAQDAGEMEHVLEIDGRRLSNAEFPGGTRRMRAGDDITYNPSQPMRVSEFRIRTLVRPGVVGWRNIMVFGYD